MDRANIEKIAKTPEDRLLLAKVWDKIQAGMRKNIPANTAFLSLHELNMAKYLFGQPEGLYHFGGYPEAERQMLIFLPDYLDESSLTDNDGPMVCLRATFYEGDHPNHRDFLGALMGIGISRETGSSAILEISRTFSGDISISFAISSIDGSCPSS